VAWVTRKASEAVITLQSAAEADAFKETAGPYVVAGFFADLKARWSEARAPRSGAHVARVARG
jgi:uncharacterized protein YciI